MSDTLNAKLARNEHALWSRWRDTETDQEVLSATIIVTHANEILRPIHDRMPVVLEPENVATWLSGEAGTELLIPAAEEKLTSWPVSALATRPVARTKQR